MKARLTLACFLLGLLCAPLAAAPEGPAQLEVSGMGLLDNLELEASLDILAGDAGYGPTLGAPILRTPSGCCWGS